MNNLQLCGKCNTVFQKRNALQIVLIWFCYIDIFQYCKKKLNNLKTIASLLEEYSHAC